MLCIQSETRYSKLFRLSEWNVKYYWVECGSARLSGTSWPRLNGTDSCARVGWQWDKNTHSLRLLSHQPPPRTPPYILPPAVRWFMPMCSVSVWADLSRTVCLPRSTKYLITHITGKSCTATDQPSTQHPKNFDVFPAPGVAGLITLRMLTFSGFEVKGRLNSS